MTILPRNAPLWYLLFYGESAQGQAKHLPDLSSLIRTRGEEQHLKVHMETCTSQCGINFLKYT